jgi:hypothetical protein
MTPLERRAQALATCLRIEAQYPRYQGCPAEVIAEHTAAVNVAIEALDHLTPEERYYAERDIPF